jgi:hypothetical protein
VRDIARRSFTALEREPGAELDLPQADIALSGASLALTGHSPKQWKEKAIGSTMRPRRKAAAGRRAATADPWKTWLGCEHLA